MITQSKLKELLHYNQDTGDFTWKVTLSKKIKTSDIAGWTASNGYRYVCIDYKAYLTHRLAWLYIKGEFPKNDIDHINGDKRDNRIINLRECTRRQNCQNKISKENSTSKYLGVCWNKQRNKWIAQIMFNYKCKYLGLFETEEEAYAAYCEAKKQLHTFNPTVRDM
jgi:hypothetical protein